MKSIGSNKLTVRARRALQRQRQRGAAAVEFALVLPLFIVLILGMIDFSHLWFVYSTMNQAARQAARVGSLQPRATSVAMAKTAGEQYLRPAGLVPPKTNVEPDLPTLSDTLVVRVRLVGYRNISGFSYSLFGSTNPFLNLTNLTVESRMRLENP